MTETETEWHRERKPQPQYQLDKAFYDRIRAASPNYKLVEKFDVPHRSGRGFNVKNGQTFRFVTVEGPQIGDVNFWNTHNTKECFSTTRTWVMEGFVVDVDTRLWSGPPWFRPLATCIEDTVINQPTGKPYHHHYTRTHCTTEQYELWTGRPGMNSCHLNLLQAIEPFGLKEEDIQNDTFMVHQKTYVDPVSGRTDVIRGDSKPGDYVEFYAELDLIVALSACPRGEGDHTVRPGDEVGHPLGVEVYVTGIQPKEFPTWTDWRPTWKGKWIPPNG
jgi:uncharacterized protein YcgI (DUF1989 family)